MKMIEKFKGLSLNRKLWLLAAIIAIPLMILAIYLMVTLNSFYNAYNKTVKNITEANTYNLEFKEEIDYSMYQILIKSQSFESVKESETVADPYEVIANARSCFRNLYPITTGRDNASKVERILNSLDRLEERIDKMKADRDVKSYETIMVSLESEIRALTTTIQADIQSYIYYEAKNFEDIRQDLEATVETAVKVSISAFIAILIIVLIVVAALNRSITKPIRKLMDTTEQVAKGDFSTRADVDAQDEVSVLTRSFNHMVEEIGELVENIKTEQLNLRATELKLLQAQINPHFLYNTLDSIIWLVEGQQAQPAVAMVSSLSDFFRITLSDGKDFISIKEEEVHVRSYLEIQHFRYRDILDYEMNIDNELYEYKTLKLTLQPLVENALYHGVKNQRRRGKIIVSGRKQGGNICFEVADNGVGMPPEKSAAKKRSESGHRTQKRFWAGERRRTDSLELW